MCKLTFGSWNYDITKLTINAASDHVFTQNYLANGEWELISARSEPSFMSHFCCKAMVSGVSYVLHIRRLSQFYVTNFIMPCALISVLTLLVFLMPEGTLLVFLSLYPVSNQSVSHVVSHLFIQSVGRFKFVQLIAATKFCLSDMLQQHVASCVPTQHSFFQSVGRSVGRSVRQSVSPSVSGTQSSILALILLYYFVCTCCNWIFRRQTFVVKSFNFNLRHW